MTSATGIISPNELREFAALPFGEAANQIRKHDPLWGLPEGAKLEWVVTVCAEIDGVAIIKAASMQEAEQLADRLKPNDITWKYPIEDFEIDQIRPSQPSPAKTMADSMPSLFPEQGRHGIQRKT